MKRIAALCGVLLLMGQAAVASTVLFSTFGPGDTYDIHGGWTIGFYPDRYEDGCLFTIGPITPQRLDRIELAAAWAEGTNELDVSLAADAAGQPGGAIETFNFTNAMGPLGTYNAPLAADSVLHPVLYPGTPYWLVTSAPVADTWAAWNFSVPNVPGKLAQRDYPGPWGIYAETLGAFRISGSPAVPVPSAILLGSLGLGVLSWLRRRRTL